MKRPWDQQVCSYIAFLISVKRWLNQSQPYKIEFLLCHVFYPPPFTCNKTWLECPNGNGGQGGRHDGRHNNMLYILLQDPQWQSTSRMINQIILMTTDEHVPLTPTFQKLEMSLTYISNKSLTHPGQSLGGTQN